MGLVFAVIVVAGIVEYGFNWPVELWQDASVSTYGGPRAALNGSGDVTRYSNIRGLQDAPRDEVPQGAQLDMRHCLQTMKLRGLQDNEAQHTCDQIIAGISR